MWKKAPPRTVYDGTPLSMISMPSQTREKNYYLNKLDVSVETRAVRKWKIASGKRGSMESPPVAEIKVPNESTVLPARDGRIKNINKINYNKLWALLVGFESTFYSFPLAGTPIALPPLKHCQKNYEWAEEKQKKSHQTLDEQRRRKNTRFSCHYGREII